MDLILELFKYLTTSFTPVEFLIVIAITGTAAFLLVNFALKRRKAIKALFGKGEDEDMKLIKEKLDEAVTQEDIDKLLLILKHEFESLRQDTNAFKEKFIEVSMIRQAILEKELTQLRGEITENYGDTSNHVEKIDERLEKINDEIRLLGRDLAVIERSLALSLNSNSGVKLR